MANYGTDAGIRSIFGSDNVDAWADLDNDQDATKMAARIAEAIDDAEADLHDRLRGGPYTIPISGGAASTTMARLANTLAGVLLYEARGVVDMDPETGQPIDRLAAHRKRVVVTVEQIRSGERVLDAALDGDVSTGPSVVE